MVSKNLIKGSLIGLCVLSLSGCASIMENSQAQKFDIVSDPSIAKITVKDIKSNKIVIENKTPFQIVLDKKAGYFQGKSYLVTLSKDGYKDISFNIKPTPNGWYLAGNLIFSGPIGWLIVDPLTGAMWNLKPEQNENVMVDKQIITVKLLSDLTDDEKLKLKKIN
ncbi:hypothetical protein [Campylobacter hyointestinalis]|uniref:hypothetical protein n=1 Tax=Campylobacter hyointestinalis TaxID=198 RepID=UPI000DCB434B|nr:hypothetical protein [Campylobacter hyointestinalis]RAZ54769.1 hypothetical protein CHL10074_06335 [Campylobacter hyointestinalis subsp. lawsonii]RAZ65178.1 hypothetical protein CHL9767_01420 [Campylobacter hyointestinalis subsp. lawsonii]